MSPASTTTYRITVRDAGGRSASATATVTVTEPPADLAVPAVSGPGFPLTPGQSFQLQVTVQNRGAGPAGATTLRYYRSSDATITGGDTLVGTDTVSGLSPSGHAVKSIQLTAPASDGTYYYGACVDPVSGESRTGNNCSPSIQVTVMAATAVGKMYWTDFGTDKIQRANLDGSGVEDLVTSGLNDPWGLALDVGARKMYWTDFGTDKIQRANLDGSGVEDLVTSGLSGLRGLALDVGARKMYWTDSGTDKIQRANLDGSGVEDLVTSGLSGPGHLALDVGAGKMYWTDSGTDKIQRANLDGSGVEDLVTGLDDPIGLALDVGAGKMYWTDWQTNKIQRANLDGSGVEDLVTSGLSVPVGLALDVSAGKMYWHSDAPGKIPAGESGRERGGGPRHRVGQPTRPGAGCGRPGPTQADRRQDVLGRRVDGQDPAGEPGRERGGGPRHLRFEPPMGPGAGCRCRQDVLDGYVYGEDPAGEPGRERGRGPRHRAWTTHAAWRWMSVPARCTGRT